MHPRDEWLRRSPFDPRQLLGDLVAAGYALGVRTRQLGAPFTGNPVDPSQLEEWNCLGLFDVDLVDPNGFDQYEAIHDETAGLLVRSRSYLDSNCAHCHQPGGTAPTGIDLRYDPALIDTGLIDEIPLNDLGLPGARVIKTGDSAHSVLWARQNTTDLSIRMARMTSLIDPVAVDVIGRWIDTDLAILDSDGDGYADDADNCPAIANDQSDQDLDGIGDAFDPDLLPDLGTYSLASPTELIEGTDASLTAAFRNDGATSAASSAITYYLSQDTIFEPGLDPAVGSCWLSPVGPGQISDCTVASARIPDALLDLAVPVEHHWIACWDAMDVVLEADETNNCIPSVHTVSVPEPRGLLGLAAGALALAILSARRRRLV